MSHSPETWGARPCDVDVDAWMTIMRLGSRRGESEYMSSLIARHEAACIQVSEEGTHVGVNVVCSTMPQRTLGPTKYLITSTGRHKIHTRFCHSRTLFTQHVHNQHTGMHTHTRTHTHTPSTKTVRSYACGTGVCHLQQLPLVLCVPLQVQCTQFYLPSFSARVCVYSALYFR